MHYFTHPQIPFNWQNFLKVSRCFRAKPDLDGLKQYLEKFWPEKQLIFTDLGRSAFQIILDKFNLRGAQIIMPAYICDTFLTVLQKYKIKPIFIDVDPATFNIKPLEIKQKKKKDTIAVLVCHTYGLACDMEMVQKIVGGTMLIIEDCSHSFGLKFNNQYAGNFSDIAFLSLSKRFPCVRGGLLICPKNWNVELTKSQFTKRDFIKLLSYFPFFSSLAKNFSESTKTKYQTQELPAPAFLNDASINLFNFALKGFKEQTAKMIPMALFMKNELEKLGFQTQPSQNNIFTFISALVPEKLADKRDEIVNKLKKQKVFCGRMWHNPIILHPEAKNRYKINLKDFPNTVNIAKRIINFPLQSHYTEKDIDSIITCTAKAAGLKS